MTDGALEQAQEPGADASVIVGARSPEADLAMDALQAEMMGMEQIDCPLVHLFTPKGPDTPAGLYARQITMPAGALIISKIHKTEHPYVISKGRVAVWIDGVGWQLYEAPYMGVTKPGTRRVLYVVSETVWTTFHVGDEKTVEEIEARIIEPRDVLANLPPMPTAEQIAAFSEGGST